jgi:PAS domain S-box-containing protein
MLSISLNDSLRINGRKYDYNISEVKEGLEKELEKQKLLVKDAAIARGKSETAKLTILRNSFFIGSCLLLVFGIFIFFAYRQKQKSNAELDKRNKEIEIAYSSLAISEGNFKQITETINDVFYLYNIKEKKYEYINQSCTTVFGLDPDYFYSGKSMKLIVHKDDLPLVVDANVKIDMGIPYDIEYRIFIKDQLKWIAEKSSPIYDEDGNLIRNSGICRDITRRKMAEEFLRKKNKDITDSIEYGSKIQNAVLVPKEKMAGRLKDFFILFKPKEIVSGDFYFYSETKNGVIIAACDCTGHGVSAGFMSMIGNSFLHEIVTSKGITNPAEILNQLRTMIIESLNQNVGVADANDGIDIALLHINNENNTAEYAGAFNPLYLIREGKLQEYKADVFPVGINFSEKQIPFKNNRIELQKGDALYIFSDGYTDQFGGPKGKKFMKKSLQELLLSIQEKNLSQQEILLEKKFQEWKSGLDQVDDVLVIGIRV